LEVYLALRSAVGEIKGGEDYSNKAEESMSLFCERMFISLVSSNDSSLEDLVPNDLNGGAFGTKFAKVEIQSRRMEEG